MARSSTNPGRWLAVGAAALLCAESNGRTQQVSDVPLIASPSPAPSAAAPPGTAPLEERIAAAKSAKVLTSILGVTLGSELDEAHKKLDRLSAPGTPPKEEGGEGEEKERKEYGHKSPKGKEHGADDKENFKADIPKTGGDEDEGHKVLWQFAGTDYSAVYVTADDKERITSITGILRPGKELPFDKIGERAKAPAQDKNSIVWDVLRPGRPLFRVLAKGQDGKAGTIVLFVVRQKPLVNMRHAGNPAGR